MQDEREPDIMGADSEELEEKVREMMDPVAGDPKPKKSGPKPEPVEAGTAPEVVGLPVSKGPLKIKILKSDEQDDVIDEQPVVKPKAKKKITVMHDDTTSSADESEAPEKQSLEINEMPSEVDPETNNATDAPASAPETSETDPSTEIVEADETAEVQAESPETESESEIADQDAETTETETPVEEPPLPPITEDTVTREAVDDIVAKEGDEILEAEDTKKAAFQPPKKSGLGQRFKHFLGDWWRNPKARWLTFTFLFLGLVAATIVPTSRYFLLNTARVRSSMALQVLDNSTQQPLKNVTVSLGGASGMTESDGRVKLSGVKLGPAQLKIEKRAFAPIERQVTVGWGSNPLGEFKLVPTGTQYAFVVTDYLSGKGVEGVEAASGEANAQSDKEGKILLTIDELPDELEVTIKGAGFREEKLKFSADVKAEQSVQLVPARKNVFVSRRSGAYDVYKIDIDGKNEEKILASTGSERDDILILPHPSDEIVAVVSTRGSARNKDGFLLSTLSLVDLSDNSATAPAQSEQIRPLGWVGDRLIYLQATEGTSAANPKRQRLMSYNYKTDENKELFTSNYFNDLGVINSKIYFAPSGAYQAGSVGLFSLNVDGTNRQTIIDKEVWNFTRTSYDRFSLSADQDWYEYKIGDKAPMKLPGQPSNLASRTYVDSPDSKKSLWVDNRDGKGVLLAYEPASQNEQILRTESGLKNPVRWLANNVVVYRINTEQQTADYALSLDGGEPKKIRDVTHTSGTDNWYYY